MSKANNLFRPTEYFKPTSVPEVVKLLAQYGEKGSPIAGGTDLLVMKEPQVEALIDITQLGLSYIKSDAQGIKIGATTTLADIEASPVLSKSLYSIIAQAAHQMGTPLVRNLGTIGGNICNALPSADTMPSLLVLDAIFHVAGPDTKRSICAADFCLGVRKNALETGELLTEIELPVLPPRTGTAFIKKGRVAAADLSLASVAVRLTMDKDNTCRDVRIALGAVAPTPLRAKGAEALLSGKEPKDELLKQVAARASEEIKPISDIRASAEYRRTLSRVIVELALREAIGNITTQNRNT